jgi:hypothetical protein
MVAPRPLNVSIARMGFSESEDEIDGSDVGDRSGDGCCWLVGWLVGWLDTRSRSELERSPSALSISSAAHTPGPPPPTNVKFVSIHRYQTIQMT